MWITSSLQTAQTPTDIALGNFDGVHRGHQTVIRPILPESSNCPTAAGEFPAGTTLNSDLWGYSDRCPQLLGDCDFQSAVPPAITSDAPGPIPTVVTFYPHPQEFFSGQSRPWLTPLEEKAVFMKRLGVRQLVLLPFNSELSGLQPEAFVEKVLLDHLQAKHISVGADFRFGHQRRGDVDLLQKLATRRGTQVTIVGLAQADGDRISSSRIRQALCAGDIYQVRHLMGRPYQLTGKVVKGQQLGRQLGFPTANLRVPPEKFLPRTGVYSVLVFGVPDHPAEQGLPGVMNLGVRPTVDGQNQSIEVHLLNWQGNLYDHTLTVTLKGFLRPEQRFDSLEHLKAQIQADCEAALAVL
ncbi:bifunctional riboflavin kinase/FAD synthetase [Oscillatoria sp. CS-180]|uniref:bifunctional riboflavin kinase/FAD synthetase n=1 Tax=Oscillatoria sp. CS-180 TaxID=3021720 RepID=UPI00233037A1|nr:bifunctional riboflavin kinase/FAD synthetase [Oscillatoria sp. CS-180]MDB9527097.1 bifunctional riboflavin kinase/FAD synthetase [Oscillatoria sp. CS-180]